MFIAVPNEYPIAMSPFASASVCTASPMLKFPSVPSASIPATTLDNVNSVISSDPAKEVIAVSTVAVALDEAPVIFLPVNTLILFAVDVKILIDASSVHFP